MVILACGVFLLFTEGFYRFFGGMCLLYLLFLPIKTVITFSRVLDSSPNYTAHTVLQFGEEGVVMTTSFGKSEIPWRAFTGWSQDADHFFLRYLQQRLDVIIPKRAFTPDQAGAFIEYLNRIGQKN
jgi:hypothetical protein